MRWAKRKGFGKGQQSVVSKCSCSIQHLTPAEGGSAYNSFIYVIPYVVLLQLHMCYVAEADGQKGKEEKPEPEANFALSGKLAAESNTVNGVVLLHQEPPESRKPSQMWRLYGFKNGPCLSHSVQPLLSSWAPL